MVLVGGLVVIALAVLAIVRRAEVRLTLLLAALLLGVLAGRPQVIVETFLAYFTREQFLLPIGCSLGFAYVLRHTGCDRHLVRLLARPLERVRGLLIPGTVAVSAVVNIPVISQTSSAVVTGSVLVPLLRAAGISPVTTGAALLLGSSIGGELLNPGAPELRTVADASGAASEQCVERVLPLLLPHLAVATGLFWLLSVRAERRWAEEAAGKGAEKKADVEPLRINPVKALVPFIPLAILFATAMPHYRLVEVPRAWLVGEGKEAAGASFDSRLIGAAMLVGSAAAALTDWRHAAQVAVVFFEGAGYALAHIVSLIVAASCFGKGVEQVGLAAALGAALRRVPGLLWPATAAMPLGFAVLCGSGMASTQSLYGFFVDPARALGADPLRVGAVMALAAAAGRTMSPVAAVTLMCASLSGADPLALARRVAVPLLAGILVVLAAGAVLG
jgi:DcuC family C4-dicarboxylate transporter